MAMSSRPADPECRLQSPHHKFTATSQSGLIPSAAQGMWDDGEGSRMGSERPKIGGCLPSCVHVRAQ